MSLRAKQGSGSEPAPDERERERVTQLVRQRERQARQEEISGGIGTLSQRYPGLDIRAGLSAPGLRELMRAGVPFLQAFEAANLETIRDYIALEAEREASARIRDNAARPVENGVSASRSAPFSAAGSPMSAREREELAKRVSRGETIVL